MERTSARYHLTGAWIAIFFNPLFAITDYYNIHENWEHLLFIRLIVSLITVLTLVIRQRFDLPFHIIVAVPFLLISLQNAYTYNFVTPDDLIGHNLNYIALFIGAAMFLAWQWQYSVTVILLSTVATIISIQTNSSITLTDFFVDGGLLLGAVMIFMLILIHTRYNLTAKEIKARLALQISKEEIQAQNEELQAQEEVIRGINENLENIIRERMLELEKKNKALEEYAFINAHKLRSPVASILGLINLMKKIELNDEARSIMVHLHQSTDKLDDIVGSITKAIEKGGD
jgi:signal transduction histidine kinase